MDFLNYILLLLSLFPGADEGFPDNYLLVSIHDQKLYHFDKNINLVNQYPVSTSKVEPNCEEGLPGTPWGLHKVVEMHGAGEPLGMDFQNWQPTGNLRTDCTEDARGGITTRAIRLQGLEDGINSGNCQHNPEKFCQTYDRNIGIHGTGCEHLIGTRASGGCIRMRNEDIIELFDAIDIGTFVFIDKEGL